MATRVTIEASTMGGGIEAPICSKCGGAKERRETTGFARQNGVVPEDGIREAAENAQEFAEGNVHEAWSGSTMHTSGTSDVPQGDGPEEWPEWFCPQCDQHDRFHPGHAERADQIEYGQG